jgi:hypothetical protein
MVASPMALRVSQPMPWRARTGSVDSERSLFLDVLAGLKLIWFQIEEHTYQNPFSRDVLDGDFGGSCHDGGLEL